MFDSVLAHIEPAIYLFKDFHHFTDDDACNLTVIRRLRDAAQVPAPDTYKTIIITSPLMKISPEFSKDVTVVDFGLPTVEDFSTIRLLDRIVDDVKESKHIKINLEGEGRERLLATAKGLTLKEAENVFAKTLVMDGKLDAEDVNIVFSEKQQIIKKSGLLEYCESTERMTHIAGLENLKGWLSKERASLFRIVPPVSACRRREV